MRTTAEESLGGCDPLVDWPKFDSKGNPTGVTGGWSIFANERDRKIFIGTAAICVHSGKDSSLLIKRPDTVLLVFSENGKREMQHLAFTLYYPRGEHDATRYHAAFAARQGSVVRYSIISKRAAATQKEALHHLKAEIEKRLGVLLRGVAINDQGAVCDEQPPPMKLNRSVESKWILTCVCSGQRVCCRNQDDELVSTCTMSLVTNPFSAKLLTHRV